MAMEADVPEMDEELGVSIETAADQLASDVKRAVNFITETFQEDWEDAQDFYNGESDVAKVANRSTATHTAVRDAIRGARPSLLRIFLHSDSINEFIPTSTQTAPLAKAQSKYVNQLFFRSGGYRALYDAIQDAMLKKYGVLKYWYEEDSEPVTIELRNISQEEFQQLNQSPDVVLENAELGQSIGGVQLINVDATSTATYGCIKIKHVTLPKFFFDEHATSTKPGDFRVMGHSEEMAKGDVLAMGYDITMDDMDGLDTHDPEMQSHSGESEKRRGHVKQQEERHQDPVMEPILITEVFARFDLDGTGIPKLYKFILGGTNYEYLAHEPALTVDYGVLNIDPEPGCLHGKSIFDILRERQNVMTSLLRATVDNAHLSNTRRLAVHETLVNMEDVLNTALGAPIRVRAPGQIQEIGTQSTVGAMLPLLQYLKQDAETQVGVTNAAMGLDHDALQSTTKEAALNTIQLSQGQIETMARNIAEGLEEVFRGILKLSLWNMPPMQTIEEAGQYLPVDQTLFQPDLYMRPNVGLGTGDDMTKLQGYQTILQNQLLVMERLGAVNPVVGLDNVYNTIADMTKIYGINDVSRYFAMITPEMSQQFAQQIAQSQQEAKDRQVDPGTALIEVERIKGQIKQQEMILDAKLKARSEDLDRELDALKAADKSDLDRDRLDLDREIAAAQNVINVANLRKDTEKQRKDPIQKGSE